MAIVISMLRGVNLGPHKRMGMAQLRAMYETLGLEDVATCLQSGNVVFRTKEKDVGKLARKLEKGIESEFGFHSDVILRTASELRQVIEANPFALHSGIDPAKLLVTFLASEPGGEASARIARIKAEAEELRLLGSELYVYFRNGVGRSKLNAAVIDRALGVTGTARNWNTVRKLVEIANQLESASSSPFQ